MRLLFLLLLSACGAHSPGESACGAQLCQPSQFCSEAETCEPGCLSDANCTEEQICFRPVPLGDTTPGRCHQCADGLCP